MRNYFELKLKGSRLAVYIIVWWLVYIAIMALYTIKSAKVQMQGLDLFNMDYVMNAVLMWVYLWCAYLTAYVLMFFMVRYTVGRITYDGQMPETDYDLKKYLWLVVKGTVLSALTLGIYAPWFVTRVIKYFASNTSFRFEVFSFNGKPLTLFSLTVIFAIAPLFVFFTLLSSAIIYMSAGGDYQLYVMIVSTATLLMFFLLSCYQALLTKWTIDFSLGGRSITTDLKMWPASWFILGQILLVIITMGLYMPAALLRMYRYFARRTVVGGEMIESRAGFSLNAWHDYFYLWGQLLLVSVTLGIYLPWGYARVMNRIVSKTYLESVERKDLPMPSAN